jgi:hypothetical protein
VGHDYCHPRLRDSSLSDLTAHSLSRFHLLYTKTFYIPGHLLKMGPPKTVSRPAGKGKGKGKSKPSPSPSSTLSRSRSPTESLERPGGRPPRRQAAIAASEQIKLDIGSDKVTQRYERSAFAKGAKWCMAGLFFIYANANLNVKSVPLMHSDLFSTSEHLGANTLRHGRERPFAG